MSTKKVSIRFDDRSMKQFEDLLSNKSVANGAHCGEIGAHCGDASAHCGDASLDIASAHCGD